MPRSYVLIEPLSTQPPSPFGLGPKGAPVFDCARLLCGAANLSTLGATQPIKLRYCYLSQSERRVKPKTLDEIVNLIFDGDLTITDVGNYLKKAKGDNREFWEDLRSEICLCLAAQKRGDSVAAFLYLYRILEHSSVALPLVYSSSISDFRKALSFIKALNRNDRDADLSVLRYFTDQVSHANGTLGALSFDFNFDGLGIQFTQDIIDQIEAYVLTPSNIVATYDTPTKQGAKSISIDFKDIPSFVVGCRNRLFHNALSNSNFKVDRIGGAEHLCKALIEPSLYWFSLVFCEIIKENASRYV